MVKLELKRIVGKMRVELLKLDRLLTDLNFKSNLRLKNSLTDVNRCIELADYFANNDFEQSAFNLDNSIVKLIDSIDRNDFGEDLPDEFILKRNVVISELLSNVNETNYLLISDRGNVSNIEDIEVSDSNKFGILNRTDSSAQYLEKFENDFDLKIPESYRNFLMKYGSGVPSKNHYSKKLESGGVHDFEIQAFYGENIEYEWFDLYSNYLRIFEFIPESYLPIADDGYNNFIAIGIDGYKLNKIYILYNEEVEEITNIQLLENSLEDFINCLD